MIRRPSILLLLSCLLFSGVGFAEEEEATTATTLKEAITKGKPILSFRYRYENVEDDAFDKDARASTLRTAFGYTSLPWKGLSFLIEGENVTSVGNDLYNNSGPGDSNNGVTDRPVVADPAGTGVNQAYGQYVLGKSRFQLGREEIIIGDARYVGNVGWRQNHQSFDGLTFRNNSLGWAKFFYSYIDNVSRITGANATMSTNLANASFKLGSFGTLTPYAYLLDYDQMSQVGNSTQTYGLEFLGTWEVNDSVSLLYELEYADQSDFGDNPNDVSAEYNFIMGGVKLKPLSLRVGYELLGGSLEEGRFTTPLATLHKFNGWADKFLVTPPKGLRDLYLQLDGTVKFITWSARYHDFKSDQDSDPYGSEFDAEVLFKTPWKQGFGLKAALYDADEFSADTKKFWVFTTYKI